ncbi:antA/AntB antirepressor family protein [Methylovulum psychrotolerans]|uniref:antA/AntB antirepressor family protein n=1 Tax=Methylovulum psychrotolerans TaxID=1704499 RepID=UPI001474B773|nr:antA/AntB antirepressor family protein [Methylovulum psychrotolerans]
MIILPNNGRLNNLCYPYIKTSLVWVKNSIAEYGFIEGLDFLLPQMGEKENAGLQTTTDYHLSVDTANVLAMVDKSDQGRAARRFFIDSENVLWEQLLVRISQTRPEAPPPDTAAVVPLPADRMPILLAVLVGLGVFWGLSFSCHGP